MGVRGLLGAGGRRLARYGMVRFGRRVGLSLPVIGVLLILPVLRSAIKRKGVVRGTLDTALDATPVIGPAKAALELLRGDVIKPKGRRTTPPLSYWR